MARPSALGLAVCILYVCMYVCILGPEEAFIFWVSYILRRYERYALHTYFGNFLKNLRGPGLERRLPSFDGPAILSRSCDSRSTYGSFIYIYTVRAIFIRLETAKQVYSIMSPVAISFLRISGYFLFLRYKKLGFFLYHCTELWSFRRFESHVWKINDLCSQPAKTVKTVI